MNPPVIHLENIGKRYRRESPVPGPAGAASPGDRAPAAGGNDLWAIRNMTLDVQPGEVLGILGENGAGKSTLLRILSGLTEPTEGDGWIKGRVGSLLGIGVGFHQEFSGRENLFMNGIALGIPRAEIRRKFDEIVAFAGLEAHVDTALKRYSSGMYLRLAFAVAVHMEPDILLVDEVLGGVDAAFHRKCLDRLESIIRKGTTVVLVSHDLPSIHRLSTRAVLLRSGRVAGDGAPGTVIANYLANVTTEDAGCFDLAVCPRQPPASRQIFRRLAIRKRDGATASRYGYDETMTVEITFANNADLDSHRLVLVLEDCLGGPLSTLMSPTIQTVPHRDASAIEVTLGCRVEPLKLSDGRYLISVRLVSDSGEVLDPLDKIAWFDVTTDNGMTPAVEMPAGDGPIRATAHWTWRQR